MTGPSPADPARPRQQLGGADAGPRAADAPIGVQELIRLRDRVLEAGVEEEAPVSRLVVVAGPRLDGEDQDYTRTLAETEADLPPIVVHRASMQVVDGVHRLRAAVRRGRTTVAVRYLDCSDEEARLLAVALNVGHGRPLTLEDRAEAARRVFASHPHWSDREVARFAGLSATKVAGLRRASGCDAAFRVGRDGRARPLDATAGRERARLLLEQDPQASLRQIARAAGISAATVADVRDRLSRGESAALPPRGGALRAAAAGAAPPDGAPAPTKPAAQAGFGPAPGGGAWRPARPGPAGPDLGRLLESVHRDPSLRQNEAGRMLLRMLGVCAVFARDRDTIEAVLPEHCRGQLAELLQRYAEVYREFADRLGSGPRLVA
ncbi:ParB/RepB/Spo0J family partition protein [Streptacidiphilus sp. N1-12]|uniref:ParB/RepB/Spo0J family partition protein n=2 Tax=Streptacidiphilus alkalitolerans TaxID=3342712 RepID=A0ABV6WZ61_9ACTN